jgi:hypothetical protein
MTWSVPWVAVRLELDDGSPVDIAALAQDADAAARRFIAVHGALRS